MKRDLELSSDEWDGVQFKPARVLKKQSLPSLSPPPPIESFSYQCPNNSTSTTTDTVVVEIAENLEDDDVDTRIRPQGRRRFVVDEDSDDEEEEEYNCKQEVCEIVDLDDDNGDDLEEEEDDDDVDEDEVEVEEDVVYKALQKCAKISKELKKELFGSSAISCDRYSEVENSSVRIVTQDDINDACATEESEFQPILKPYQLVGVNFLLFMYRKSIAGAILADEMGLGKTIQAITYLTLLKHLDNDPGPHLIVCPASLLENWEREFKKWCPSFSVLQYHGSGRAAYAKELSSLAKAGLPPPFNVLLVCYSLFERHSEQQKDDRKLLKRWQWSCVLMDEAHAMKDKNSYRWKNLMGVAKNANQRLMLTGTPLQNDLHELWSLLEFMMPDLFATGDVDLKKLLSSEDKELITRIKSILGPFILRRLKSDVMQQLVPKTQKVEYVVMEKHQNEAYKESVEEYRTATAARLSKLSNGTSNSVVGILPKRQISNYFVQFRKIANHPLLVRRLYSDEDVVRFAEMLYSKGAFGFECGLERAISEVKSYNDFSIHRLLLSYFGPEEKGILRDKYVFISAKCKALSELLPRLKREGHRALIFSQWTSMLDILEWALDVIGVRYKRLDGSTQVTERQNIVDSFNNDPSFFACLLSTRAGGQGLNLTGADTVIIHDMDFNPQIDRQAEDRCHRIGQTKPVTVYRLVTKDTVDENVYKIAKRKLTLDAAVLESGMEVDADCSISEKTMGEILSALLMG
ncbi:DNA helicase [Ranunculus cassubicifolius]